MAKVHGEQVINCPSKVSIITMANNPCARNLCVCCQPLGPTLVDSKAPGAGPGEGARACNRELPLT